MAAKLHIYRAPENLYRQCAAHILAFARETLQQQENFHIALAGGTTPRALYQQLSRTRSDAFSDWNRLQFYFGDERSVPADHQESNYRMASESLFQPLAIGDAAIHRIPGELEPEEVVARYSTLLQELPSANDLPRFDLVLLGMGADGHIASLFPGSPLLQEQQQHVGAAYVEKLDTWRYSLTLPVLNNARRIILLVSGAKKADVLRHVIHCDSTAEPLPVELLNHDKVEWYLDAEAARFLDEESED
jgi:6-phosphogluconolactonase